MPTFHYNNTQNESEIDAQIAAFDQAFDQRLSQVASQIASNRDLRFIGLTGPTCSGKTTAARKITSYLGDADKRLFLVSLDDFFFDSSVLKKRAIETGKQLDYDSEATLDLDLLSATVDSLLACKPTQLPKFDFMNGKRVKGEIIEPDDNDFVLFEGIQILYPGVRRILGHVPYRSVCICPQSKIEVAGEIFDPNEIRFLRRIVRDSIHRGADASFTIRLWQGVRENEEANIFPYLSLCNDLIDSTVPFEIGVLKPLLEKEFAKGATYEAERDLLKVISQKIQHVVPIPTSKIPEKSLYKEFI